MPQASRGTAPAGSELQPVKVIIAVLAVWPHAEVVPVEFDPTEILRQILPPRHILVIKFCVRLLIGSRNLIEVNRPGNIADQIFVLPELRKIKFQPLLLPMEILPLLLIETGLLADSLLIAAKVKLISCDLYVQALFFHLESDFIVIVLNVGAYNLRFLGRSAVIKEKNTEIMDHIRGQEILQMHLQSLKSFVIPDVVKSFQPEYCAGSIHIKLPDSLCHRAVLPIFQVRKFQQAVI